MTLETSYTGNNRILAALPQADFARFFAGLEPRDILLREMLQTAATPIECVYFVERGVTSIPTIMADGAAIGVGMIGAEGIVGLVGLSGDEAAAQHAIVQIPGSALRMPLSRLKTAFAESDAVRAVMLRFAGALLHLSAQTAACNRLHSIEQPALPSSSAF
jgi:CRP-like cAMP-binding protein